MFVKSQEIADPQSRFASRMLRWREQRRIDRLELAVFYTTFALVAAMQMLLAPWPHVFGKFFVLLIGVAFLALVAAMAAGIVTHRLQSYLYEFCRSTGRIIVPHPGIVRRLHDSALTPEGGWANATAQRLFLEQSFTVVAHWSAVLTKQRGSLTSEQEAHLNRYIEAKTAV